MNGPLDREAYNAPKKNDDRIDPDLIENETASTVYTPSCEGISDGERQGKTKRTPKRIAVTAALLVLCLMLGVLGGAGGTMLVLSRKGGDDTDEGGEKSNAATIYKETSIVNLIELPEIEGEALSIAQVYQLVADSVVAITTSVQMSSSFSGGFYLTKGSGSGVILSKEGHIVTNYHVIDNFSEIEITLHNGSVYSAVYLDGDPALDVALLKIEPAETLSPAVIGSSDGLVTGQDVVAVGNSLGTLPGTLTDGIISALARTVEIEGYKRTLLQTNAAINPGNSGGGLFDRYGRLVGIVNAKESSEGVEGLGFAIPIDDVFDEIVEIIEDGYIHGRACLDLEVIEIKDSREAYALYRNQMRGIYVQASSYGEDANFREGDRLHSVNGVAVSSESDLYAVLAGLQPGDTADLVLGRIVISSNGLWSSYVETEVKITVTLREYVPSYAITFQ